MLVNGICRDLLFLIALDYPLSSWRFTQNNRHQLVIDRALDTEPLRAWVGQKRAITKVLAATQPTMPAPPYKVP